MADVSAALGTLEDGVESDGRVVVESEGIVDVGGIVVEGEEVVGIVGFVDGVVNEKCGNVVEECGTFGVRPSDAGDDPPEQPAATAKAATSTGSTSFLISTPPVSTINPTFPNEKATTRPPD